MDIIFGEKKEDKPQDEGEKERRRELIERIRRGELDDRMVEIKVEDKGNAPESDNEQANQISIMISSMMPKRTKKKKVTVAAAKKILAEEAADEMVDMEVVKEKPSTMRRKEALFSSMKSIKSQEGQALPAARTFPGKGCSGISSPLWKALR